MIRAPWDSEVLPENLYISANSIRNNSIVNCPDVNETIYGPLKKMDRNRNVELEVKDYKEQQRSMLFVEAIYTKKVFEGFELEKKALSSEKKYVRIQIDTTDKLPIKYLYMFR